MDDSEKESLGKYSLNISIAAIIASKLRIEHCKLDRLYDVVGEILEDLSKHIDFISVADMAENVKYSKEVVDQVIKGWFSTGK